MQPNPGMFGSTPDQLVQKLQFFWLGLNDLEYLQYTTKAPYADQVTAYENYLTQYCTPNVTLTIQQGPIPNQTYTGISAIANFIATSAQDLGVISENHVNSYPVFQYQNDGSLLLTYNDIDYVYRGNGIAGSVLLGRKQFWFNGQSQITQLYFGIRTVIDTPPIPFWTAFNYPAQPNTC